MMKPGFFSAPNQLRLKALAPRRRRASLIHQARLEFIATSDLAIFQAAEAERSATPFMLLQVIPERLAGGAVLSAENTPALQHAFTDHISGSSVVRWNQDGLTLADKRRGARDVVTFFRMGGGDLFSRASFYPLSEQVCVSPSILQARIQGAFCAVEESTKLLVPDRRPSVSFVDISLVGVAGLRLLEDLRYRDGDARFDRDHVYLTWTVKRTEADLSEDLAPFLDAVCQGGGLPHRLS